MDARPPAGPGLADPALGEAHCGAVAAAFVLRLAAETHTLRSRSSAGSDPSAASICVQVRCNLHACANAARDGPLCPRGCPGGDKLLLRADPRDLRGNCRPCEPGAPAAAAAGRIRLPFTGMDPRPAQVDTTGGWTPELGDWRAWLGKPCCCGFLLLHRARARAEFCAVADFLGRLTAGQRRGLHPLFLRHLDVIRAWKLVCDETLAFWSGGDDNILRNARSLLQAGPALARCDRHVATLLRVLRSRADPGSGADAESHPSAAGDGGPGAHPRVLRPPPRATVTSPTHVSRRRQRTAGSPTAGIPPPPPGCKARALRKPSRLSCPTPSVAAAAPATSAGRHARTV